MGVMCAFPWVSCVHQLLPWVQGLVIHLFLGVLCAYRWVQSVHFPGCLPMGALCDFAWVWFVFSSWVCCVHAAGCSLCIFLGALRDVLLVGDVRVTVWVLSVHFYGCGRV